MKKIYFLFLVGTVYGSFAQNSLRSEDPVFDEENARKEAIRKGIPERVMEEYLHGEKVRFENKHNEVHLNEKKSEFVTIAEVNSNRVINQSVHTTYCGNSDLSFNNYTGWTGEMATACSPGTLYPIASWSGTGINGNNGTPIQLNNSPCNNTTGFQVIHNMPIGALSSVAATAFANGYDDNCNNPTTGLFDLSCTPTNGTNSIRLSSAYNNYTCAKLVYPLSVTSTNALFSYQFAVVIEDGTHPVGEQPSFLFGMKDVNGNPVGNYCLEYNVDASGATTDTSFIKAQTPCSGWDVYYRKWRTVTIDLTAFIGQTIYAEFQTVDCPWSGHYAYAYISASCGPNTISSTGFCSITGNVTLSAPAGYAAYQWYGPNNPSNAIGGATASTYTTTGAQSGDQFYVDCITLQGCTTKLSVGVQSSPMTVNYSGSTSGVIAATGTITLCPGDSLTLSGAGANSYTWTGGVVDGQQFFPSSAQTYTVTSDCYDVTTVYVQLTCGIGMNSISNQTALEIVPNPSTGSFVLQNASDMDEVKVYDILGNLILANHPRSTKFNLSLANEGIYFVTIKSGREVITRKIIVNK